MSYTNYCNFGKAFDSSNMKNPHEDPKVYLAGGYQFKVANYEVFTLKLK